MTLEDIGPTERLRRALDRIPEWDARGNEQRFWWQLLAYLGGRWLMASNRDDIRAGRVLHDASIDSFAELAGVKIGRWLASVL